MKRLILLITLFITGATFAQVEKASDGKIYEVMFTPNLDGDAQFGLNATEGHVMMRTLTTQTL